MSSTKDFYPLNICVLTISDTRTLENDTSGDTLETLLRDAGHKLYDRKIVIDDIYQMRSTVSQWVADEQVQAVITTGGTGFTGRDSTPEAIKPLLDKHIDGFGELFRQLSYGDIGTSTIQSRAFAGLANRKVVFALPGSTGACKLGFSQIIQPQLDSRTSPCNFHGQLKRA